MAEDEGMTKEAAIELFRENMGDMGQIGPVSLFLENSISMTDPAIDGHNIDAANNYERVQTAQSQFRAQEIHDGVLSGSVDGVRGGIAERVADNRDSKEAKAARDEERANDTAFYLGLMADLNDIDDRIRALDDEIDHLRDVRDRLASGEIDVAEASRDEQVRAAIEAWEEETGRTFNPTSADAEEILLSIVDGAISKREAARSGLEAERRDIVEQLDAAEGTEELERAREISAKGETQAVFTRLSSEEEDSLAVANSFEDGFSDNDFQTTATAMPSTGGLSGMNLNDLQGHLVQTFAANAADVTAGEPTQTASLDAEEQQQIVKNDLINPAV